MNEEDMVTANWIALYAFLIICLLSSPSVYLNHNRGRDEQIKKIEMLTESEVVEFQGSPKNGMARTANGRVCLLESHEVSCLINLNDAIHIYSDIYFNTILRSNGEILGISVYNDEDGSKLSGIISRTVSLWGDKYHLTSFQSVKIAGCCTILRIGNPIKIDKLQSDEVVQGS
jgi:hypothetical protein